MNDSPRRAAVLGTGHYVPQRVVTNRELESKVDTTHEWIVSRTGITQRHVAAPDESTSDMALHACRHALELSGTRPDEVDLLVVGTVTGDMPMPATAAFLAHKLGATRAFAFDLSAACAGSLFALSVAEQYIRSGQVKRALVVGVELLSRILDWEDRSTVVLFGDAAGALVLGPATRDNQGIQSMHLHTDGSQANILTIPGPGSLHPMTDRTYADKHWAVHMNGKDVFRFAVRSLTASLQEALHANHLSPGDVAHVVPHQANLRIIEAVLERVGIPLERAHLNIDRYGNTSSASLPLTLDEANRAGKLREGDTIAIMAIGGGMSWGSGILRW